MAGAADGAKRYFPAFLDLTSRLVVVIGSGKAAERRALKLARHGADVTIITATPSASIVAAQADGTLLVEQRDYVRGDLSGVALVVCLAEDPEIRRAVAAEARSAGCLVNVTGDPALSTFLIPGAVHREPLQIAVSTGGLSPELAKRVRKRIAELYDGDYQVYASLVADVRALGAARLGATPALAKLMEALLDSDLLKRLRQGPSPSAEALFEEFAPEPELADSAPREDVWRDTAADLKLGVEPEADAEADADADAEPDPDAEPGVEPDPDAEPAADAPPTLEETAE